MSPAQRVIDKFGGVRATARALEINASAVCRWRKAKSDRGCDGRIPNKHYLKLLNIAKNRKIDLTQCFVTWFLQLLGTKQGNKHVPYTK